MQLNVEMKEVEAQNLQQTQDRRRRSLASLVCLIFSGSIMVFGDTAGPLLLRVYFLHGGKRIWLASWLETAGWPLAMIPIYLSYLYRKSSNPSAKFVTIGRFLFMASAVVGLLTGSADYLYSYGVSFLPASTTTLIFSTELVFTAFFAKLMVKQRFTPYSINAIFLLCMGAIVLGVHSNGDRPPGVTHGQYLVGFILIVGSAALFGLLMPLIELSHVKTRQEITPSLVLESQMIITFFATALCTIGMLCNKDFQAISKEASEFELGKSKYYLIIIGGSIAWQFYFLGLVGVVACSSSLLGGVLATAVIPVTQLLAVIFLKEKFGIDKCISLIICLWGFASYFYGEFKKAKKEKGATVSAK